MNDDVIHDGEGCHDNFPVDPHDAALRTTAPTPFLIFNDDFFGLDSKLLTIMGRSLPNRYLGFLSIPRDEGITDGRLLLFKTLRESYQNPSPGPFHGESGLFCLEPFDLETTAAAQKQNLRALAYRKYS